MVSSVGAGNSVNVWPSGPIQITRSVSCTKYIHGYYACLHRGDEVIWETSKAFGGCAKDLFHLVWDLSLMQPGDNFTVIGFISDHAVAKKVCSCQGPAESLHSQQQNLLLS